MDIFWSGFVEIKNFDIFFQIHFSLEIYIQQTYEVCKDFVNKNW